MSESLPPLSLPNDEMWRSLDLVCGQELHGGFQSRVFDAERDGERIAVKLTDSRLVDSSFHRRLEVTSLLADTHDSVVRPIKVGGAISAEIGSWFAVVYPFA